MPRLTVKQAQAIVREFGCSLKRTDGGDYRLADTEAAMRAAFPNEPRAWLLERIELRSYYTNDVADAVQTARYYRPTLQAEMTKQA